MLLFANTSDTKLVTRPTVVVFVIVYKNQGVKAEFYVLHNCTIVLTDTVKFHRNRTTSSCKSHVYRHWTDTGQTLIVLCSMYSGNNGRTSISSCVGLVFVYLFGTSASRINNTMGI